MLYRKESRFLKRENLEDMKYFCSFFYGGWTRGAILAVAAAVSIYAEWHYPVLIPCTPLLRLLRVVPSRWRRQNSPSPSHAALPQWTATYAFYIPPGTAAGFRSWDQGLHKDPAGVLLAGLYSHRPGY